MLKGLKAVDLKMEKIYGMHKLVGLQLFWSATPTFSSGTPTFCQMGVLNSCFQNPSESSGPMAGQSSSPAGQICIICLFVLMSYQTKNSAGVITSDRNKSD